MSFWPPALVQQALPAIIFAALRRFLGAVLFLGPRPSSRLGAPFWPSGLTLRSSGLAFSQPLTLAVRCHNQTPLCSPKPMNTRNTLLLVASHIVVATAGFAAGIYALPILIAPPAPTMEEIKAATTSVQFTGKFKRDLKDSDSLHWGEGVVSVAPNAISLVGRLAPGPDYKLYLSPEFVETEADFNRLKKSMVRVGDVKTFDNFVVSVPAGIEPAKYSAVVVWCETFGQFITAAKYR